MQRTEGSEDCMESNEAPVNWYKMDDMLGTKP